MVAHPGPVEFGKGVAVAGGRAVLRTQSPGSFGAHELVAVAELVEFFQTLEARVRPLAVAALGQAVELCRLGLAESLGGLRSPLLVHALGADHVRSVKRQRQRRHLAERAHPRAPSVLQADLSSQLNLLRRQAGRGYLVSAAAVEKHQSPLL